MTTPHIERGPDTLWTARQLADRLGVHLATLYRNAWWMSRRVRVGGAVRFDPSDFDLYIALQKGAKRAS